MSTKAFALPGTELASRPVVARLHDWVTTVDHKRLGILYIAYALTFLVIAGIEATVIRIQLIRPHNDFVTPQVFNRMFTMHGTTMIFFVIMPVMFGFANYLIPLMIGARDMAFPRLNAFSFWITAFGGLLLYFSLLGANGLYGAGNAPDSSNDPWRKRGLATADAAMSEAHPQMMPWLLPLAVTSTLVVTALIYLRGWISLRRAFPSLIGRWRLAAFTSGLVLIWAAVGSPLATLDHRSLTIHMLKHLLLMTIAAPLLLAGAPAFPLVCGLPKLFIKSHPPLVSLMVRWAKRSLAHPVLCWLAATTTVIGWHLPTAFQWAMRSHDIHALEDATFLVAGLLFWWPIFQSSSSVEWQPSWSMALYLFFATLPCDILSAFLVFCNRLVYPVYLSTPQLFNLSCLEDQQCAGALMWVWVTLAYLIPAAAITMRILSDSNMEFGCRSVVQQGRQQVRSVPGSVHRAWRA